MNIERIIGSSFRMIKDSPRTVLPQFINWVPILLFFTIVLRFVKDLEAAGLDATVLDEATIESAVPIIMGIAQQYIPLVFLAIGLMIFTSSFVRACYPELSRQYVNGKKIDLKRALESSRERFLSLIATNIVFGLGIFALFVFLFAPIAITPYFAIISVIGTILIIAYAVPLGMMISPVVVLEKKSIVGAIKQSYAIIKNNKFNAWVLVIVIAIILMAYNGIVSLLTSALTGSLGMYTVIIDLIAAVFSGTFSLFAYNFFYFDILKEKKK